ncbi:MAG: type VI secretion system ATPase TssH [Candidatus Eisenbacteria bacterium]|nr:type VI secretion system ATPase TssH [Candidatus Eisenbacteria bacterium]
MQIDFKSLMRKLDPTLRKTLEGAVGRCMTAGHYEVTVEHWLIQLLDDPGADVVPILRHFEVSQVILQRSLQKALDMMRSGNPGKPTFSNMLQSLIRDSWMGASLTMGHPTIRSGVLLATFAAQSERYSGEDFSSLFEQIRLDELARDMDSITATSRENAEVLAAMPAVGGGAPGGAAAGGPGGAPAGDSAIARFMIDFTDKASKGQIDPVCGRDREIRQMIDILSRRRKNNPICVGEPGVGKTAVVEGLALRIIQGDVPDSLKNVRLLSLDLGLLQAGASVKGEFENRLKNVIAEVKGSSTPIITFIDEAHTLIGAGGAAGTGDAANLLKPALARGELRTIAATTWSEYKKYFEKDPALERRFQLVKLDEPSAEDAIVMMRGLREQYEKAHGVRILDEGVVAAAQLSSRYIAGRQLPDKAVDLLDTAGARVKIGRAARPEAVDQLERNMHAIGKERDALKSDARMNAMQGGGERIAELEAQLATLTVQRDELVERFHKEKAVVEKVLALRAKVEEAAEKGGEAPPQAELDAALAEMTAVQGDSPLVPLDVDARLVAQVVESWTGIPVGKMMKDEATSTLQFASRVAERLKGQDHAIEAVDRGLRAARAGLKNPQTPIGVFLFVGPSGVGKTELATTVADLMFGGDRFLTVVNMSEFQEKHSVSRLIGTGAGYVGYGEGGVLTNAVRQRPYSVVLLDEVEKADPEVLNLFYQVFDKGVLADGEGRVIDFKNTIVFLTSNLATDTITQMCSSPVKPTREELVAAIRPALSAWFKPALLARIEIVPFLTLAPEFLADIVRLKLRKIEGRLRDSHKMSLVLDEKMIDVITRRCTEVETGARNIDHIITQTLLPMLSSALLERMASGPLPGAVRMTVAEDESFQVEFIEAETKGA